ncbi:MAG: tetratricopeptide repeat protein [Thermoanaerobaculia bacterium]
MKNLGWAALVLAAACSSGSGGKASAPVAPAPADAQLAQLQTSMTEMLERLDVLNDRMTRIEQAQAEQQVASRKSQAVPAPVPAPVLGGGPVSGAPAPSPARSLPSAAPSAAVAGAQIADVYRNGITLFGSRRIAESRAAFQKVFDADPHGELADNALFWIGETFYAGGQFQEAMKYYTRVSRDYSDQNKAPDALYKLALSYEHTSDLGLARKTLEEVISKYPYSTLAASARAELKRIKY